MLLRALTLLKHSSSALVKIERLKFCKRCERAELNYVELFRLDALYTKSSQYF